MAQQVAKVENDGAFKLPQLEGNTRYYEYLKFKEGQLLSNDVPVPPETLYLVLKIVATGRMFFGEGVPPDSCEPEEIEQMNKNVPEADWPLDFNGNPEPPWKLYYDVFLVNPLDGSSYIFSNCTIGHSIAVCRLSNQVESLRTLHGANILPVVKVGTKPMKTKKFGTRARPHFEIVRLEGVPDKPRSASEICDDRLPDHATKGKPWDDGVDF